MASYMECLGESVLEKLRSLHCQYDSDGSTRRKMLDVFGYPHQCLVCARPLWWKDVDDISNDVDPWFCSGCCPICDSERELDETG